jgi:hypothetical protein
MVDDAPTASPFESLPAGLADLGAAAAVLIVGGDMADPALGADRPLRMPGLAAHHGSRTWSRCSGCTWTRGVPEVGQLSCRVVVFMDQAAEDITAAELLGDQRLRLAIAF